MRYLINILISIAALTIFSTSGMSSSDLIEKSIVRIEVKEPGPVRITQAFVYREDGLSVVRGEAAFPIWKSFGIFSGHIDIDIVSPGNVALKKHNVPLVRKRIPKRRGRRAFFISRLETELSKGAIVRIAYHMGNH